MKCECPECEGSGEIVCPECQGTGIADGELETCRIHEGMKNFKELRELQRDAIRVRRSAERLIELKPDRAESYEKQLSATISCIEQLWEQAIQK